VIFNSIIAAVQIPLIILAAYKYGVTAVAVTWFVLRLVSFVIRTFVVHQKFAPGIHRSWLLDDIGPSFVMTAVLLVVVTRLDIPFEQMSRVSILSTLIGVGLIMLLCNILASRAPRNLLVGAFTKRASNEN